MNDEILLRQETIELLLRIVGDTGEDEDADDVIHRIAMFYLERKTEDKEKC